MQWFVREVWQADGDPDWARQLEAELDDLEERGHQVVSVTSHPQKSGKPSKGRDPLRALLPSG
jgi:hypothetical protein